MITEASLTQAMRDLTDSLDHLQRVYDCLFGDGKETDIELDLDKASNLALRAIQRMTYDPRELPPQR